MEQFGKLTTGMRFKNYKSLCEFLSCTARTGNGKKVQIGRWSGQFSWVKDGNAWVVTAVHRDEALLCESLSGVVLRGVLVCGYLLREIENGNESRGESGVGIVVSRLRLLHASPPPLSIPTSYTFLLNS